MKKAWIHTTLLALLLSGLYKAARGKSARRVSKHLETSLSSRITGIDSTQLHVTTTLHLHNPTKDNLQFTHPQVKILSGDKVLISTAKVKKIYDLQAKSRVDVPIELPVKWESVQLLLRRVNILLPQGLSPVKRGLWLATNAPAFLRKLDLKAWYKTTANGFPYSETTRITI